MQGRLPDKDRIAITGIGLVTSLGCSAPSTLAAIRGGIACFSEHETVLVNADTYGTQLCGARVARLPEHVVSRHVRGADRAIALLAPAIRECTSALTQDMLAKAQWRLSSGIQPETVGLAERLKAELHELPIPALQVMDSTASAFGRCLFFENLIQAAADLSNGSAQMAVVGCVDSLCDSTTLEKLLETDQLKSGSNPEGIVAGEAAGVIVFELESHARRRHASIHAFLSAWGRGSEPHPWTGTTPSTAVGLTSAYHDAFEQLADQGAEIDMVISDLNGERARAHELGLTACRIFPVEAKTRELKHPADCVGDCGTALGVVLLATAAGLMSDALPPARIALSTSDDGAARRVLCLEKGDDLVEDAVIGSEHKKRPTLLPRVIAQHNDEAPFLWLLRDRLARAPHRGLYDLARHDERIDAHLDGLRWAGEDGWSLCSEALPRGGAGEYFAAAVLAFKSGDENRIAYLFKHGAEDTERSKGIISSLGWLSYHQAEPYIQALLAEQSPDLNRIGIASAAIQRIDPGEHLNGLLQSDDLILRTRALKAAGELGRTDLLPALNQNLLHPAEACRFFAAWSASLLGDRRALPVLQFVAGTSGPYQEEAVKAAFRIMDSEDALKWHADLAASPETLRMAITGAGTAGCPVLVPWLIEQMKTAALARMAGEAFTSITGADIVNAGVKGERPYGFKAGLSDDLDVEAEIDTDKDLPWPDMDLVSKWWLQHKDQYKSDVRYFLGKSIGTEHLQKVLLHGSQRQRASAAVELTLMRPGVPVFETCAPGFRQIIKLGAPRHYA